MKGFDQKKKGLKTNQCDGLLSPVLNVSFIWVALGMAAIMELKVEQLNLKTKFFHGGLEEELNIEQPKGLKIKGKREYACRLKRAFWDWHKTVDIFYA